MIISRAGGYEFLSSVEHTFAEIPGEAEFD